MIPKYKGDTIKTFWLIIAILLTLVLAFLRIYGEKGQLFQASAHLFVGFLIGVAIVQKKWKWCGIIAVTISLVEVGVFLQTRQ